MRKLFLFFLFGIILIYYILNSFYSKNDAVDINAKQDAYKCVVDLGVISKYEIVSRKILIHNSLSNDVLVHAIKPSCGCSIVFLEDNTLKSGVDNFVMLQYNPLGKSGKQEEYVSMSLDKGKIINIYLHAFIDLDIDNDPQIIQFVNNSDTQDKTIKFTKIKGGKLEINNVVKPEGLDLSVIKGDVIKEGDTIHLIKPEHINLKQRITYLEIKGTKGEFVKILIECKDQKRIIVEPALSSLYYYAFDDVIYHRITVIRDSRYTEAEVTCDNPAVTCTNDNDQTINPQGLLVDTYSIDVDCRKLKGDSLSKITVTSGDVQEEFDLYIFQER